MALENKLGIKSSAELAREEEAGCTGLDYHYRVFQKNPDWVKKAHDLGLTVNVWTVDKEEVNIPVKIVLKITSSV